MSVQLPSCPRYPGRVILGDCLPEDLLVAGREVDESEVVGAGEADAAEPSRGGRAAPVQCGLTEFYSGN